MSIKDEYLEFRNANRLKTNVFADRVLLQKFLRDKLDAIWRENPKFTNGGLLSNYMTRFAIGFAYYDCRPTSFCRTRCYGLPISGLHDYHMLRLGVITSESLRTGDTRFVNLLKKTVNAKKLKCLKIGHWGDAVLEQIPHVANLVRDLRNTAFWWYTRKQEVAIAVNQLRIPNLKAYLSLDPSTEFPGQHDYPFGITYLFGDRSIHPRHKEILSDQRLVAVFPLKKGRVVEDPTHYCPRDHPRMCEEKRQNAWHGGRNFGICLSCNGRCNFLQVPPD